MLNSFSVVMHVPKVFFQGGEIYATSLMIRLGRVATLSRETRDETFGKAWMWDLNIQSRAKDGNPSENFGVLRLRRRTISTF